MARRRFNTEEKTLLVPGTLVEWHNGGGYWYPAIILSELLKGETGYHYAKMRNLGKSRTISPGNHYRATPEKIRPASAATVADWPESRIRREMNERY